MLIIAVSSGTVSHVVEDASDSSTQMLFVMKVLKRFRLCNFLTVPNLGGKCRSFNRLGMV